MALNWRLVSSKQFVNRDQFVGRKCLAQKTLVVKTIDEKNDWR